MVGAFEICASYWRFAGHSLVVVCMFVIVVGVATAAKFHTTLIAPSHNSIIHVYMWKCHKNITGGMCEMKNNFV